jgi:hypothetical protein
MMRSWVMSSELSERGLVVPFDQLDVCDLIIDAVYETGPRGTLDEEPLNRLLRCGNMGGFRTRGSRDERYQLVALFTTFDDSDWPDTLDAERGRFVYFGDNKTPGRDLHDTPKGGNELLRRTFEQLHITPPRRDSIPPFFVFSKAGRSRDVRFHGLAVPGAPGVSESDDLVAIWKTVGAQRFQNYRAILTILDARRIPRAWIEDITAGTQPSPHSPEAWCAWRESGQYRAFARS